MNALATLPIVLPLSLIVTRVATVALGTERNSVTV